MAKRKPSQRPERKMDGVARAIARDREKTADTAERLESETSKAKLSGIETGAAGRKRINPAAPAANRRQKKG